MSNEATVSSSLNISKQSSGLTIMNAPHQASFQVDVDGTKGPVPGAITVSQFGTVLDLSQLTTPGLAWVTALFSDEENYVELGLYDPQTDIFYPWMEIRAGQSWPIPFSRNLLEEYASTGTGTTGPTNQLMAKSWSGSADIALYIYEK